MSNMRKLISLMEGTVLTELDKGTLKSYSKERGKTIHADQRDSAAAHQMSADASAQGDTNKAAKWDSEASWLHNRAEKGAKNVAKATTKIAAKKDVKEGLAAVPGINPMVDEDDVMETMTDYDEHFIGSVIRDMYPTAASREELMSMVAGHTGYGANPDFQRVFDQQLDKLLGTDGDLSDNEQSDSEFAMNEARKDLINPAEVNAIAKMPHDVAKSRAAEIIQGTSTSDTKKLYLLRQLDGSKNTMAVVKLLYDMILKGEGNGVQGSSYSRKFDKGMEEDLNNGYSDIEVAQGEDFFPDGADSPVVKAVGPSGARQGDNPEQKKMQVAEVHKELVLGYRNFLKESTVIKKKR